MLFLVIHALLFNLSTVALSSDLLNFSKKLKKQIYMTFFFSFKYINVSTQISEIFLPDLVRALIFPKELIKKKTTA